MDENIATQCPPLINQHRDVKPLNKYSSLQIMKRVTDFGQFLKRFHKTHANTIPCVE